MLNGKVRVGNDGGKEQLVAAHQRSQLRGGQVFLSAISRNEESPEWAMLRPAALWSNPVSARLELRGLPAGAVVALDGQVIGVAPLSTLVPSGTHSLTVLQSDERAGESRVVARREFVSEVGQLTVLTFTAQELARRAAAPVDASQPAQPSRAARCGLSQGFGSQDRPANESEPSPAAQRGAGDMLAEAHKLMRAGRFDAAAAEYQALRRAYAGSPEASTVLVSLAELQVDRLGSPKQALQSLERYFEDGDGALVEEARRVRIRALRALGDTREGAAIEEFLQAHPEELPGADATTASGRAERRAVEFRRMARLHQGCIGACVALALGAITVACEQTPRWSQASSC